MAGFSRPQPDLDGFTVAHLADQNHLGRLAQRRPQPMSVSVKIHAQLALVESGFFMRMLIFHRVFQGDDVHRLVFIDFIQNGRQRGGFTRAGGPGDKDDPVDLLGDLVHGLGQLALVDGGNFGFQFAQHNGDVGPLGKNVHAEARLARQAVGHVAGAGGQ